ncbi:MAG: DUF952 domain-containing protein [Anaerolineae bacterium]|nr:DUF952 domain-containing protein [Anaerolineae bacterium]
MSELVGLVPYIWHITTPAEWAVAQAQGQYTADSLLTEGFIHCSTPAQVVEVANGLFRGRNDLILLHINSHQVQSPIVYEDCYQTGQQFPHIYGPLNLDAVTAVYPFPPDAGGRFRLPLA